MTPLVLLCTLLTASATPLLLYARRRPGLRVLYGTTDTRGKYPYVVALISKLRRQCSGTLITSEWVLTAAHCIACEDCIATHIQYGNMSTFPNATLTKTEILKKIRHPGYLETQSFDDIGLLRVEPVLISQFGKLSAVDYNSLMGQAVEYAGFGTTEHNDEEDDRRPLVIGEGVVRSCGGLYDRYYTIGPYMCVAPKCDNNHGDSAAGDSGGPLFYDHKIVGVVSAGIKPIGVYTTVSPYITWIQKVIGAS